MMSSRARTPIPRTPRLRYAYQEIVQRSAEWSTTRSRNSPASMRGPYVSRLRRARSILRGSSWILASSVGRAGVVGRVLCDGRGDCKPRPGPCRHPSACRAAFCNFPRGRAARRVSPGGAGGLALDGVQMMAGGSGSERSRRMTARLVAGVVLVMALGLAGGCQAKEGQKVVGYEGGKVNNWKKAP